MPKNLQLKIAVEKRTPCKNSLTLLHENENMTSVSRRNQQFTNDLPIKIREKICSMSFAKFKTKY